MDITKPLEMHAEAVHPEWIDYNGHMNVAYYLLAFDHASDRLFDYLGIGQSYMTHQNCSIFTAEAHVTYDQEVRQGDPMRFTTQLLGCDRKRLHYFHKMYHATAGYLAATNELMVLHVDMETRRTAPFPEATRQLLDKLVAAHGQLPVPSQVGRVMGMKSRRPG